MFLAHTPLRHASLTLRALQLTDQSSVSLCVLLQVDMSFSSLELVLLILSFLFLFVFLVLGTLRQPESRGR